VARELAGAAFTCFFGLVSPVSALPIADAPKAPNAPKSSLSVPEENFHVDAPEGWTWVVPGQVAGAPKVYNCQGPSGTPVLRLAVSPVYTVRENPELMVPNFLKGLRSSLQTQGLRLAEEEWKPTGALGPGSARLTARLSGSDVSGYFIAHLYQTDRLYVLSTVRANKEDPAALQSVLRSFRLLSPRPVAADSKPPLAAQPRPSAVGGPKAEPKTASSIAASPSGKSSLDVEEENFHVEAPKGWVWSVFDKSVDKKIGLASVYVCRGPSGSSQIVLTVTEPGGVAGDPGADAREFVKGMRLSAEATGAHVDQAEWKLSELPAHGSARVTARRFTDKEYSYQTAYLYRSGRRFYVVSVRGPIKDEPSELQAVLRSFRLLDKNAATESTLRRQEMLPLAVLVLAFLGSWLVNVMVKRPALNPGFVGVVSVLIERIVRMIGVLIQEEPSFAIGMVLGQSIIPLTIAGLAGIYLARRRRSALAS
jgi:hypothetical protein